MRFGSLFPCGAFVVLFLLFLLFVLFVLVEDALVRPQCVILAVQNTV